MPDYLTFFQIGTSLWIVLAIVFGVVELMTMGLVTIWFCGGALAAAVVAGMGASAGIQIGVFFVASAVLLWLTRPFAKKIVNAKTEKTNSEALIDDVAFVTKDIAPFEPGQVKIQGKEWTAVCVDSSVTIEKGSTVKVRSIEGVKLVVEAMECATDNEYEANKAV